MKNSKGEISIIIHSKRASVFKKCNAPIKTTTITFNRQGKMVKKRVQRRKCSMDYEHTFPIKGKITRDRTRIYK
jgi:hypothetical protein